MSVVKATNLVKRFRQAVKAPGLKGALRHLISPRFEEKTAVDGIDLTIEHGERVAYLGPNGAGKSTTIKMLTGIIAPTAGEVRVCGRVPRDDRIAHARNIGVVFGQRTQLWFDLPVIESFRLLGDIYALSRNDFERNLDASIEALKLGELLKTPARNLSLGQRMRCDLAAALLHRPAVLFLDEPTIGLDLNVKDRIRAFMREVADEHRTTILLTSHDLGDIEGICERIVVIDRGKKLFDGPLPELVARVGSSRVVIVHLAQIEGSAERIEQALGVFPGLAIERIGGDRVRIAFEPSKVPVGDVVSLVLGATRVQDLRIEQEGIEGVVRKVYAGGLA